MVGNLGSVSLDLDARLAKFESDIGRAARLLEREMGRAASMAERAMQRASRRISDEIDKIAKKAEQFGRQVVAYFAVTNLVGYLRQLGEVADAYANIQAKVRLAAGEHADLGRSMQAVFDVAQRTYNSYESTAALVQKTAAALRSAGRDSADAFSTGLRLSEVFNKSLVVSGASAQEAAAATLQFAQAIASGRFQGDEFKSVMENNSRFAKLLADSLGITTAQLREMSTAGKLNAQAMLGVLEHTKQLDAEFALMPVTIGRATTQLANAWTKYIGQADQASGASARVARAIQAIANNLPQIVSVITTIGTVAVAILGGRVVGAATAAGAALLQAAGRAVAAEMVWRSMTAAAGGASVAMSGMAVAARGLLAMVGGIPGLVAAAAVAIVYYATRSTEVSKEIERMAVQTAELEKRSLSLKDALTVLSTGAEPAKKSLLEMKSAQLDAYEAEMRQIEAAEAAGKATEEMGERYLLAGQWAQVLRGEVEQLRAANAALNYAHLKAEVSDLVRLFGQAFNAARNWRTTLEQSVNVNDSELAKEAEQLEKHSQQVGRTKEAYWQLVKAKDLDSEATKRNIQAGSEAYKILSDQMDKRYARVLAAARADDASTASMKANREETKESAKAQRDAETAADKYAKSMDRLADIADKAGEELGPLAKAENQHRLALRDIRQAYDEAIEGAQLAKNVWAAEGAAHTRMVIALEAETRARGRNVAEAKKQLDVASKYRLELTQRVVSAGLSERDSFAYDFAQRYREELEKLGDEALVAGKNLDQMTAEMRDSAAAAFEAEKAASFWRSVWEDGISSVADAFAGFASGQIRTVKDLGKSLVDVFRQTFQRIVAEFIRSGLMRMFAGFFGGGSSGGGFFASLSSGFAALVGAGALSLAANSSAGGIDLRDPSTQRTGGFTAQYQAAAGGGGAMNYLGGFAVNQAGNYALANTGAQWISSNPGTVGTVGAWGGALLGAYYGSRQGDGRAGTVGATAAGAIAGYYAGTVAAGALVGASGAAAAGTTAAAGAAAGASGAAAAIPIVGWVAAIALIVDKVTGGKIFGSKYRPESIKETVSFGGDGATATAFMTEWKYRNQLSQAMGRFGGALLPSDWGDKDRRGRAIPVDPEVLAAIKKVFDALEQTAKMAAKRLGVTAMEALDATFETLTVYDKKGKVKRTETVGTILGKQYKEDFDQFQKRMHAELIIATVGKLSGSASAIAEAYRKNADELLDAAQTMLQAQRDLNDHKGLIGGGSSLTSIMAWVAQQRQGDEELTQTYERLAQASAQYRDILDKAEEALRALGVSSSASGQMREALYQLEKQYKDNVDALNKAAEAAGLAGAAEADLAKLRELNAAQINKLSGDFWSGIDAQIKELTHVATPAGDFAAAMQQIAEQMHENERIANMLARAQGRNGASAAELYRIHELGARQMQAAINKLNDVARQQARSLGYLGPQTLDEIDGRIAELEGRANDAASAVGGFGSAMSDAAGAAKAAADLLLGALSPLNDQQKLQYALQGLYGGTVSQEQVLEIGRRLYASTQRYTDLFNQVMAVGRRGGSGGGGLGGSASGNASNPLSSAEQEELRLLRIEREEKRKQQRYQEAVDFAATIASLASAQGLTFEQVADKIGFKLSDLAKDLGLSNEELIKYLNGIDVNATAVPDSITSNFDRLLAALDKYWGGGTDAGGAIVTIDGRRERAGQSWTQPARTEPTESDPRATAIVQGLDGFTRTNATVADRTSQRVADAVDRNTEAVRDMGRDFRDGMAPRERSTRYARVGVS